MAFGDGIRRNIASVDPTERAALRDAFLALNSRFFSGTRTETPPGGVSWWFKQDEIHQGTHVHRGPEFLPWHREIVNRLEGMLRAINPQLSLHYWDWKQDPRAIPNGNLGNGNVGPLNLFTADFMGYGGAAMQEIGEPWRSAGYYNPTASPHRDDFINGGTAADPPRFVERNVGVNVANPVSANDENDVLNAIDYATMRERLEVIHDNMHRYVNMGGTHTSFRDPFVFLLHSNVDRLFARWQTDPAHPERLVPATVYGTESNAPVVVPGGGIQNVNNNVEPWSSGVGEFNNVRPWYSPENQGEPHSYKHESIVAPPCYDTNHTAPPIAQVVNIGTPPVINFNDVPTGEITQRAAVFRIYGCGAATVRVKAGASPAAPFSVLHPSSGSVTVSHGNKLYAEARIWIAFTAGAANVPVPDGAVTFECPEAGKEFAFVLKANVIERPRVALMLALDQSGSMDLLAGTSGAKRIDVLKDAARTFAELVPATNGVGLIRFDHDSYAVNDANWPGLAVTDIATDADNDPGRVQVANAVDAHATNINGSTSVGDGVDRARQVLNFLPAGVWTHKAMIVLTDGLENEPLWLSDVTGSIDNRTFAIGLGGELDVNTVALDTLTNGTGGYLLLTGLLTPSTDDYFRLRKYFLAIMAGVTNNDIVLDPTGQIGPGATHRHRFVLNEADIGCTALLMTDHNVVDLALEAPDGTIIDEGAAAGLGMTFARGAKSRHFRFTLPAAIGAGQHDGTWDLLLEIDKAEFKRALHRFPDNDQQGRNSFATHGARYSAIVHAYSNLRMNATVGQSGYAPGATINVSATLTEYGAPLEYRSTGEVELTRPGGGISMLAMTESVPGTLSMSTVANDAGVYHARILVRGATLRGRPFTREALGTAAVWRGGDTPYQPPAGDTGKEELCRLIACLLSEKNLSREFEERLKGDGVSLDGLRECFQRYCRKRGRRRG